MSDIYLSLEMKYTNYEPSEFKALWLKVKLFLKLLVELI